MEHVEAPAAPNAQLGSPPPHRPPSPPSTPLVSAKAPPPPLPPAAPATQPAPSSTVNPDVVGGGANEPALYGILSLSYRGVDYATLAAGDGAAAAAFGALAAAGVAAALGMSPELVVPIKMAPGSVAVTFAIAFEPGQSGGGGQAQGLQQQPWTTAAEAARALASLATTVDGGGLESLVVPGELLRVYGVTGVSLLSMTVPPSLLGMQAVSPTGSPGATGTPSSELAEAAAGGGGGGAGGMSAAAAGSIGGAVAVAALAALAACGWVVHERRRRTQVVAAETVKDASGAAATATATTAAARCRSSGTANAGGRGLAAAAAAASRAWRVRGSRNRVVPSSAESPPPPPPSLETQLSTERVPAKPPADARALSDPGAHSCSSLIASPPHSPPGLPPSAAEDSRASFHSMPRSLSHRSADGGGGGGGGSPSPSPVRPPLALLLSPPPPPLCPQRSVSCERLAPPARAAAVEDQEGPLWQEAKAYSFSSSASGAVGVDSRVPSATGERPPLMHRRSFGPLLPPSDSIQRRWLPPPPRPPSAAPMPFSPPPAPRPPVAHPASAPLHVLAPPSAAAAAGRSAAETEAGPEHGVEQAAPGGGFRRAARALEAAAAASLGRLRVCREDVGGAEQQPCEPRGRTAAARGCPDGGAQRAGAQLEPCDSPGAAPPRHPAAQEAGVPATTGAHEAMEATGAATLAASAREPRAEGHGPPRRPHTGGRHVMRAQEDEDESAPAQRAARAVQQLHLGEDGAAGDDPAAPDVPGDDAAEGGADGGEGATPGGARGAAALEASPRDPLHALGLGRGLDFLNADVASQPSCLDTYAGSSAAPSTGGGAPSTGGSAAGVRAAAAAAWRRRLAAAAAAMHGAGGPSGGGAAGGTSAGGASSGYCASAEASPARAARGVRALLPCRSMGPSLGGGASGYEASVDISPDPAQRFAGLRRAEPNSPYAPPSIASEARAACDSSSPAPSSPARTSPAGSDPAHVGSPGASMRSSPAPSAGGASSSPGTGSARTLQRVVGFGRRAGAPRSGMSRLASAAISTAGSGGSAGGASSTGGGVSGSGADPVRQWPRRTVSHGRRSSTAPSDGGASVAEAASGSSGGGSAAAAGAFEILRLDASDAAPAPAATAAAAVVIPVMHRIRRSASCGHSSSCGGASSGGGAPPDAGAVTPGSSSGGSPDVAPNGGRPLFPSAVPLRRIVSGGRRSSRGGGGGEGALPTLPEERAVLPTGSGPQATCATARAPGATLDGPATATLAWPARVPSHGRRSGGGGGGAQAGAPKALPLVAEASGGARAGAGVATAATAGDASDIIGGGAAGSTVAAQSLAWPRRLPSHGRRSSGGGAQQGAAGAAATSGAPVSSVGAPAARSLVRDVQAPRQQTQQQAQSLRRVVSHSSSNRHSSGGGGAGGSSSAGGASNGSAAAGPATSTRAPSAAPAQGVVSAGDNSGSGAASSAAAPATAVPVWPRRVASCGRRSGGGGASAGGAVANASQATAVVAGVGVRPSTAAPQSGVLYGATGTGVGTPPSARPHPLGSACRIVRGAAAADGANTSNHTNSNITGSSGSLVRPAAAVVVTNPGPPAAAWPARVPNSDRRAQ